MTSAENLFIVTSFTFLIFFVFFKKNIPWGKLGFLPKPWWRGWLSILIFSTIIFTLIQLFSPLLKLPVWVTDKDPVAILLFGVFLQEIIFRSILINWSERFGKHTAILVSALIFSSIHLFLPHPWLITGISIIGGIFWGWHFLKYRNIFWLVLSHLIVNLSFNYLFLIK